MADFLWEDIISHYGCFGKLIIDRGLENKDIVVELAKKYGIKRVVVFAYYPQANGMIERNHKSIIDTFLKMLIGGSTNWVQNLPAVL